MSFRLISLRGTGLWHRPAQPNLAGQLQVMHLGEGATLGQRLARTRDSLLHPAPEAARPCATATRSLMRVSAAPPDTAQITAADSRHTHGVSAEILQHQQVTGAQDLGRTEQPLVRSTSTLDWYLDVVAANPRYTVHATRPTRQLQAGAASAAGRA